MNKTKLANVAFFTLMVTIFLSLNDVVYQLFGVGQFGSPLILICCFLMLAGVKISYESFNSVGIKLWYLLYLFYTLVGSIARGLNINTVYEIDLYDIFQKIITSMIIIFSVHQFVYNRIVMEDKKKLVFYSIFIPIVLSCGYAVYQGMSGIVSVTGEEFGRVMGVFSNPNGLGLVSNVCVMMAIYSIYADKGYMLLKAAVLIMGLYVSFLSLSRSAIITSAFILILSVVWFSIKLLKINKNARRKYLFITGLPILSIVYLVNNFEDILSTYTDYGQSQKILGMVDLVFKGKVTAENTSDRAQVYKIGIDNIIEHPLIGSGLGFCEKFPASTGYNYGCHNTFILIFGNSGVFVFILYLTLIGYVAYKSFFINPIYGFFSIGMISIWALQNLGSHNGLDEKMDNILITVAILFLVKKK